MPPPRVPPEPITPPEADNDEPRAEPPQDDPKHANIPYSADFTGTLMERLRNPESRQSGTSRRRSGIRVIARSGLEAGLSQELGKPRHRTVLLTSIDATVLPQVELGVLPLPLDDPRRVYTSAIPGVLLTHPGGFLEGGPSTATLAPTPLSLLNDIDVPEADTVMSGTKDQDNTAGHSPSPPAPADNPASSISTSSAPPPAYANFIRHFLSRHPTITTSTELHAVISAETETQLEALRGRMREREEAVRRNAEVQKKIAELVTEREFERKVMEGWRRKRRSGGEGVGVGG